MISRIPWGARIFALIWLAVALVWPLRESLTMQETNSLYSPSPQPTALGTDDLLAQSFSLSEQFIQNHDAAVLTRLDELASKHPEAVWIRADRLRLTTLDGAGSPRRPKWLTPQVVDDTIACARAGHKSEPDNSFWGWMEAVFALQAGRKTEALRALQQAANASRWNDYTRESVQRTIALRERSGPLLYEARLAINAAQLFPHYAALRNVGRAVTKEGIALLTKGDEKGAFQRFAAVLGAGRHVREDGDTIIAFLVGFAIERNVWHQVATTQGYPASTKSNAWNERDWTPMADAFERAARKAGYPNLALNARREYQDALHQHDKTKMGSTPAEIAREYTGVSALELRIGTQGAFLLTYLAMLAFAGALFWICGQLWLGRSAIGPTRGEVVGSVNFTFWAILCSLGLLWYLNIGSSFAFLLSSTPEDEFSANPYLLLLLFPVVALAAWLLPIIWPTKRRYWSKKKESSPSKKEAKVPTTGKSRAIRIIKILLWVFLAFFCVMTTISNSNAWQNTIFAFPVPLFAAAFCALALLAVEIYLWRTRATGRHPHPVAFAFALVTLASTYTLITQSLFSLLWFFLALVAIGFLLTLWPWKQSGESRNSALDFFIAGASRSAGVLAVTWSIFFLLGSFVVWPMRAKMNHQLDRMLAIGEMEWRSEQTQ